MLMLFQKGCALQPASSAPPLLVGKKTAISKVLTLESNFADFQVYSDALHSSSHNVIQRDMDVRR